MKNNYHRDKMIAQVLSLSTHNNVGFLSLRMYNNVGFFKLKNVLQCRCIFPQPSIVVDMKGFLKYLIHERKT